MVSAVSVVIPAYNAAATLERVLLALSGQAGQHPDDEVIVVDDGSSDGTAALAAGLGARVVTTDGTGFAGGARNHGWEVARHDRVVFLDADAVPLDGWRAGFERAHAEHAQAVIGCARRFSGSNRWSWVAHLQVETPYLPLGAPRATGFVSSYCMSVPRALALRFDPSYGGEDALFCADAARLGHALVFDPRIVARHEHARDSFAALRRQQDRLAYGLARLSPLQPSRRRRTLARFGLQYFALARLPVIWRRVAGFPELRRAFLRNAPLMVLAEWTLGLSALRYALRRPPLRGQGGAGFREAPGPHQSSSA